MSLIRPAAILWAFALAAGCRAPVPVPKPPDAQHIRMDPVRFVVGPDGKVRTEFTDPTSLFEEADRLFREKSYERALAHYDRLLKDHPGSRYEVLACYNSGLTLEKLTRFEEATQRYRRVLETAPKSRDAVDAHFRLGECYAKLKRWREVVDLFTPLLLRDDLKPADAFEARVRKGVAHAELSEEDDAERTLLRAARYHDEASRAEPLGEPALLAQAYFTLGEIARNRMAAHPLRLPQASIEQDLSRKGQLLLTAQARFLRAVRTGHPEWAPAAGHQLGALYERFRDDVLGAPVPPELTPTEREVYLEELRKKVLPLIRKAIGIYQRNLMLSERIGAQGDWVVRTRERMERLQKFLEAEQKAVGEPKPAAPAPAKPPAPPSSEAGRPPAEARQPAGGT
jgi:tetratricopeptide (TPR) repeat protein